MICHTSFCCKLTTAPSPFQYQVDVAVAPLPSLCSYPCAMWRIPCWCPLLTVSNMISFVYYFKTACGSWMFSFTLNVERFPRPRFPWTVAVYDIYPTRWSCLAQRGVGINSYLYASEVASPDTWSLHALLLSINLTMSFGAVLAVYVVPSNAWVRWYNVVMLWIALTASQAVFMD